MEHLFRFTPSGDVKVKSVAFATGTYEDGTYLYWPAALQWFRFNREGHCTHVPTNKVPNAFRTYALLLTK